MGDVDRDREADALGVARDRSVDADDVTARVEQRTATVARIDGRVGLDEIVDGVAVIELDLAAHRRDDAAGHGVRVGPQRAPDGDRQLADLELARIPDWCDGQPRRFDLDDGEVGQGVVAVDLARELTAVLEADGQLVAAGDDVAVGKDPALGVVDHT